MQSVVLPGGQTDLKLVTSGIPQGSVLGPLLFLLYINDIADLFGGSISVKLFADDIKIYTEIFDTGSIFAFQDSIDALCKWASDWQMGLSIGKCHHMRVGLCSMPHAAYTLRPIILLW